MVRREKKGQYCLVKLTLPDSKRVLLQQAQRACWGQAGYVPVTVLLMLTSAQLVSLRRELDQALCTDCRAIADWLAATYGVRYSVSGLTDLLHRLGFSHK